MPILTKSGRVAIAEALQDSPIHLAWGLGDGAWLTPPAEDANATALMNEAGRRTATIVGFVTPNPSGDIVLPTGTFSVSATPTNHLYISTTFDFIDAQSAVIREVGVFVGSVPVGGLPAGQKYFTPAQLADHGSLLHLENIAPIYRSPVIRERFEIVITF